MVPDVCVNGIGEIYGSGPVRQRFDVRPRCKYEYLLQIDVGLKSFQKFARGR